MNMESTSTEEGSNGCRGGVGNGNGNGTCIKLDQEHAVEIMSDLKKQTKPEVRTEQCVTMKKISEERSSSIGGLGGGGEKLGISLDSTPADSPEEYIESMESSEHESTNGESSSCGPPVRPPRPVPTSGDSKDGFSFAYTQKRTCYKITNRYRLPFCRECHFYNQSGRKTKNIICRFATFRKLWSRMPKNGKGAKVVSSCGFCDPMVDPKEVDIKPWLVSADTAPESLDMELSLQLISHLGDQLCELFRQEREMILIKKELGRQDGNYWKRMVDHVREMCDVCATTVFNYHWTCDGCGFMVCPECFKARKSAGEIEYEGNKARDLRDPYKWLWCTQASSHGIHKPDLLSLTQIIPQKAIDGILKHLHEIRGKYGIDQKCGCDELEKLKAADVTNLAKYPMKIKTKSSDPTSAPQVKKRKTSDSQEVDEEGQTQTEVDLTSEPETKSLPVFNVQASDDESDSSDEEGADFLGSLLTSSGKKVSNVQTPINSGADCNAAKPSSQNSCGNNVDKSEVQQQKYFFVRTSNNSYYAKSSMEEKVGSLAVSLKMFPNLKHTWLCSGRLLNLQDPDSEDNYKLFQDLWVRGQPVIVSNVGKKLNRDLWTPEAFNKDCGENKNDLVNCMTGKTVPSQLLSSFWEGFEDVSKRLTDDNGTPMLLKLKDWPAGEDFATFLPDRFEDLMSALPLKEFTHRTGRLNLAARLPSNFIKPDLGPKMYIAYGDGNHLDKGTTNLHLDISDAVNVMVHVGVPKNCDVESHNKAVMDAIETSDCDELTVKRVRQKKAIPGALWHIYRPWDADKIRDLINKVSVERGHAIEPHHDPIHDQVVYLDKSLRHRLREEYNVNGFPIVQCEGDAVFIPAGAPHQVRNLHNCIKIAEDFVSPENVSHCFQLTEEFRNLSETHSNHEDKLQIKNIVYHAVKDALSVVLQSLEKEDKK